MLEPGHMKISSNQIFDSKNGFGIYLYATTGEVINNAIARNFLGGMMIVGKSESVIKRNIMIKGNKICNNRENGISLLDYIEGSIDIEECFINENTRCGINISVSRKSFHRLETCKKKITAKSNLRGMSFVRSCEIKRNGGYGLMISLTYCMIYGSSISDNTLGDTFSPESDDNHIIFNDEQAVHKAKCKQCTQKHCIIM